MRNGIVGRAENISNIGVCLVLPAPVAIGEQGVVELEDPIQRRKCSSRIRVERIELLDNTHCRAGCSLFPGLSAHEILYLRLAR